ncbi:glutamate 5-kinase [Corynebacterium choanae]|uniref:Glutamate 5-kinase n=1 Tax=Corynebacterium choanae TaxID=1862358 RepID=A0A3G6J8H6_9CORY|nr:glutamate 5-kinase [Corynebacterium choanae]AZA14112.1 Glutamate 5-kinase [Corynebacterium choanae]
MTISGDPIQSFSVEQQYDRARLARAKKIVVKIGSSSLTTADHTAVDRAKIDRLTDAMVARLQRGAEIVVVSSGAVAAGMGPLGLTSRPQDLATKQAAASVGQALLAQHWAQSFARYGITTGQVLLTAADAGIRSRARNAQRTLERLRQLQAVAIVNENDTVATQEMRFGDNDRLAALVANLIGADLLLLLSDVVGLYDRNPCDPAARFIAEVASEDDLAGVVAGGGGAVGTGGMATKVSAAMLANRAGIPVLLTAANQIDQALESAKVGTMFHPQADKLTSWKHWALFAADVCGTVTVDEGCMQAVVRGGNSLLAVGITGIDGDFHQGDIVEIVGPAGEIIGRGEVAYDQQELVTMMGKNSALLPAHQQRPVVHADYLSPVATNRN